MTILTKGWSHDLQFSLYMDKPSLQKRRRAATVWDPTIAQAEQGSE